MNVNENLYIPTLKEVKKARKKLGDLVRRTPVWEWKSDKKDQIFGAGTALHLKLELFQYGGSFKCRGSLLNILGLSKSQLKKGVTAVSAGNHAISVAYAAKKMGTSAKVVMPKTANSLKIERCNELGAEVVLADDVYVAFEKVKTIERNEERFLIHPFDSEPTVLGTATAGLEFCEQVDQLDAVIIPIGGGGLIAGMASCIKQIDPEIEVIGVEPEGADSMSQSLRSGQPEKLKQVNTIADSLAAPHAEQYSFELCQRFVDEIVTVNDQQMAGTMQLLFNEMKLAVEPAGASAVAALRYKLLPALRGKNVGILVCGTNIDLQTYYENITTV